jgi:hypothetical protein
LIVLLATASHRRTHLPLTRWKGIEVRVLPYHRVLTAARLPGATYIFADMDRLNFWDLELSARLYRLLAAAGMRVLNDPAAVQQRFALLRALHASGRNDFRVYRVEEDEPVARYPVFLRTQSAHRGALSDLLHDPEGVARAVTAAVREGIPRKELMLVEYCAEPIDGTLFRKLAVYRVGATMVPSLAVHESRWHAKAGELGIADKAMYEDEHESVRTNRYGELIRPAFEAARIEYGRADFGMVQGRPQVYEINTNPSIKSVTSHPFPIRVETARLGMEQMRRAFAAIDAVAAPRWIALDDRVFARERRKNRWTFGTRWVP